MASVVAEFNGGPLDGTVREIPYCTAYEITRMIGGWGGTIERGIYDRIGPVGHLGERVVLQWRGWQ